MTPNFLPQHFPTQSIGTEKKKRQKQRTLWVGMKIDLKKSGGDFSFVNTFPQKLKSPLLDLSVLYTRAACQKVKVT
jgi:hypothetical protein